MVDGSRTYTLSDAMQAQFSEYVESRFGIKMPMAKKSLLEGRLSRRLRALDLESFEAYWDYLQGPEGQQNEIPHFSDLVSTHKTDFFRENQHFDYLSLEILPKLTARGIGTKSKLTAWSCGCSTGEEPYTLAMVLDHYSENLPGPLQFDILGTDVSQMVIERALRAVYPEDVTEVIPLHLKKKYLRSGTGGKAGLIKISPELRQRVRFRALNLMDAQYQAPHGVHLLFFRNVLIYFERDIQQRIILNLKKHLAPGGYLFLGHSESIFGFSHGLSTIEPTIYQNGNH